MGLEWTGKVLKKEAKATKWTPVIKAPYEKLISVSREQTVLTNKPRELTVSANLVQLKNQWEATCQ